MILEHDGHRPQIDPKAIVARNVVVRGDVHIGSGSVVLDGAVLTAESGRLSIGENCVIMEHAVLRGTGQHPCTLGNRVLVGPHAHLSGCSVADNVFIATRASIFNGAHLETDSEVRIGAVVHINSRLPSGSMVPIGWIAVGDPAQLFPPEAHETLWPIQKSMDFAGTVWGKAAAQSQGERIRHYATALRTHLREDRIVSDDG